MDRCKYCEVKLENRNNLLESDYEFEVYIGGDNYLVHQDEEAQVIEIKINYCPMCGKKLE